MHTSKSKHIKVMIMSMSVSRTRESSDNQLLSSEKNIVLILSQFSRLKPITLGPHWPHKRRSAAGLVHVVCLLPTGHRTWNHPHGSKCHAHGPSFGHVKAMAGSRLPL